MDAQIETLSMVARGVGRLSLAQGVRAKVGCVLSCEDDLVSAIVLSHPLPNLLFGLLVLVGVGRVEEGVEQLERVGLVHRT